MERYGSSLTIHVVNDYYRRMLKNINKQYCDCPNCRRQNTSGATYCAFCGTLLPYKKSRMVVDCEEYKWLRKFEEKNKKLVDELEATNRRLEKELDKMKSTEHTSQRSTSLWRFILGSVQLVVVGVIVIWILPFLYQQVKKFFFDDKPLSEFTEIRIDEETGKYGLYNNIVKRIVLPCEYDTIVYAKTLLPHFNCIVLFKDEECAVADFMGNVTIPLCDMDQPYLDKDTTLVVVVMESLEGPKEGIMNSSGRLTLRPIFFKVLWEDYSEDSTFYVPGNYVGNILPAKEFGGGPWTLYDRVGRLISNHKFDSVVQTGHPDFVKVADKSMGLWALLDNHGEYVLGYDYVAISCITCNRFWAKKKGSNEWILYNTEGEVITTLPAAYTPSLFKDGQAMIVSDKMTGYCDTLGTLTFRVKEVEELLSDSKP